MKSELAEWAYQIIWVVCLIVMWELNGLAEHDKIWIALIQRFLMIPKPSLSGKNWQREKATSIVCSYLNECDVIWWTQSVHQIRYLWCNLMDRLCPIKSGTCSWDLWCHLMARLSAIKSGTCAWSPWHHIYIWYLPNIVPGTDGVMAGHVQKPGPQEPFIGHVIRL